MGNAPAHERVPDTEICLTDQSPPTGAALVAALTVAGVVTSGQAEQTYALMAQAGIALSMFQAFVRTNSAVPTGEPLEEWRPKHAGGVVG